MSRFFFPLVLSLLFAGSLPATAADKVWAALVLATEARKPQPVPAELKGLEEKLRGVFGYNQFGIIGQGSKKLTDAEDQWLIPSEKFYLRIQSRQAKGPGRVLHLQLYNRNKLLAETDARLGAGSPLFIRGAQCGEGQLLIVLMIQ